MGVRGMGVRGMGVWGMGVRRMGGLMYVYDVHNSVFPISDYSLAQPH